MCLQKTHFKNQHMFNTLPKYSASLPTLFLKVRKVKDKSQLSGVYSDPDVQRVVRVTSLPAFNFLVLAGNNHLVITMQMDGWIGQVGIRSLKQGGKKVMGFGATENFLTLLETESNFFPCKIVGSPGNYKFSPRYI